MINETVLEMHYHRELMREIREQLQLGTDKRFNFYKYSPQLEKFVGFDQAYAKTEMTTEEFFEKVKSVAAGAADFDDRFVGYFLQFKVVHPLTNMTASTPDSIKTAQARPHFRANLYTKRLEDAPRSQHETLFELAQRSGAFVYYACPMLFERVNLYADADLNSLRLVDVKTCPSSYPDNEKHFIYFQTEQSEPIWKSNPVEGRAISPKDFAEKIGARLQQDGKELAHSLVAILAEARADPDEHKRAKEADSAPSAAWLASLADALTIVHVGEASDIEDFDARCEECDPGPARQLLVALRDN